MKKFLYILIIILLLTGCNINSATDSGNIANELDSNKPEDITNTEITPDELDLSNFEGTINTEVIEKNNIKEPLKENEFYLNEIKIGDKIIDLTVSDIKKDTIEPGSVVIEFTGEIKLSGNYNYYNDGEGSYRNNDLYITLDENSTLKIPRKKSEDMNFPVTLSIIDSEKESLFGEQGSNGIFEGVFYDFIYVYSPHKPADSTIKVKNGKITTN